MRPLLVKGVVAVSAVLLAGPAASDTRGNTPDTSRIAADSPGEAGRFFSLPPGDRRYSFYFTRAAYSDGRFGRRGRGGGSWATDYPKADQQFLTVLRRLTNLDALPYEHPVQLDDPQLRRYPFIYTVEVGNMSLTESEVTALRGYLLAGGFMMADDFWGDYEWANFAEQMRRVFPEYSIVEIPKGHPVLSALYDVDEIIQVPNVGNARAGITSENGGIVPHCRGIFDENGRLMVVINWNTDIGDAWEWAEQPDYPLKFSTYAYQMGVNFIVYAMSH
ncbi:MAG: DUF4159 domain-containing protein [Gemmatimonadetes bacterium]|nr:DUF4159 domain-containing protein [Gemmatimonadota bacterium]